jgi:hypothetical protein
MLGVHYKIANIEAKGFRRHVLRLSQIIADIWPIRTVFAPNSDPPVTALCLANMILYEAAVAEGAGL